MSVSRNFLTIDEPNIEATPHPNDMTRFWDYQESFCGENEKNLSYDGMASVAIRDLYMPNMAMRYMQGSYQRDACLVNKNGVSADLPGSCLFLKGSVKSHPKANTSMLVESGQGRQNFLYDPHNEFRHWIPANSEIEFIHFSVDPTHLINMLPEAERWADDLRTKIVRKQWIFGKQASYITVEQARILNNILHCPLTGRMREIMFETSVTQMILLQLWSLFQEDEQKSKPDITKHEKLTAQEIREFLDQSFLNDHSLDCLSKHFGLNTNKLMFLFKKVFGKSIFDYLTELKMNHAYHLIQREEHRVIDVSRVLGYKNANHFSAAFKKHFGLSPTQVR